MTKIFTSCDSVYFEKFAPALVGSCRQFEQPVHVHIINPTINSFVLTERMVKFCGGIGNQLFTYSFEFDEQAERLTGDPLRARYASNRFFRARDWLANGSEDLLIIVDVDCYLNKPLYSILFATTQIGLYLREPLPGTVGWEQEGSRVAAGIVALRGPEGLAYITAVCQRIEDFEGRWFVDQWALYQSYIEMGVKDMAGFADLSIPAFDSKDEFGKHVSCKLVDWDFEDSSMIWTGKGPRKYENERYVKRMNEINEWLL